MKRIVQTALAASIALSLTACHNHRSSTPEQPDPEPAPTPDPTTLAIKGKAVKGTLIGATVELFMANDLDTALGSVQTGADGTYEVSYTDENGAQIVGAFIVKVSADEDTTMTCDAAVSCGDVDRGQPIPAAQLAGLELSSFTFADNEATEVPEVNVNSLSTMATDAILSAAAVEGSAIDLSDVDASKAIDLQIAGSEVVGAVIGVDLAGVDLFALPIVDASVSADVATDNAIAATLTMINASLSNTTVAAESTLGDSLVAYFTNIETITGAIFADENVDLAADFADEIAAVNVVQAEVSAESALIITEVELDTGETIAVKEIPAALDPEEIADIIGDVTVGTGATGGEG